jgi:hypothetical protein
LVWTVTHLFILSTVAGMTGMCHHAQFARWSLTNFLSRLASNCDPYDLCLPNG